MNREVDIREFAEKVERLCDFVLDRADTHDSPDKRALQRLKEDAADIQFMADNKPFELLTGLDNHLRGII